MNHQGTFSPTPSPWAGAYLQRRSDTWWWAAAHTTGHLCSDASPAGCACIEAHCCSSLLWSHDLSHTAGEEQITNTNHCCEKKWEYIHRTSKLLWKLTAEQIKGSYQFHTSDTADCCPSVCRRVAQCSLYNDNTVVSPSLSSLVSIHVILRNGYQFILD